MTGQKVDHSNIPQIIDKWQEWTKVLEYNIYMLTNQIQCDVTFKVGPEEKEIRAHRYVLTSRSPVFFTMLYGSLSKYSGVTVVPDIKDDIFDILLR